MTYTSLFFIDKDLDLILRKLKPTDIKRFLQYIYYKRTETIFFVSRFILLLITEFFQFFESPFTFQDDNRDVSGQTVQYS
jgi:hypothetical protein